MTPTVLGDGPAPVGSPSGEPTLVRAIGTGTLAANFVNLTLGAGIFTLPALVAAELGDATAIGYAMCGVVVILIFLCFAEAGSRIHTSGGAYAYTGAAFGPYVGFLTSSLLWFGYSVLSDAAIADALLSTVGIAVPWLRQPVPRALTLVAIFGALATVNVIGVRAGARLAVGLTVVKVLPLLVLIVVGLPHVGWSDVAPGHRPSSDDLGAAMLLLYFGFSGGEASVTMSGEIRNPARTVPRAVMLGVGTVLVLYFGLQAVAQSVLGSELPGFTATPLAETAGRLMGDGGRGLLLVGAALSMLGNVSGDLLASPRCLYAAAKDGLLPAPLGAVHPRYRTPHVAIVVFAALACLAAILGAFRTLAILSSASVLLVDLGVCLAVLKLRRREGAATEPAFRVPGGPLIPLASAAIVLWVLSHLTRPEFTGVGLMLLTATLWYVRIARRRAKAPADEGSMR